MTDTAPIEAVAELIRTHKLRVDITPSLSYEVRAPCLLTQLQDAIEQGSESAGGTRSTGSRPPIATDAFDLWCEIEFNTHSWAAHLGLNRHDTTPESPTPWVGRLLRHCAATAISTARALVADRIEHNARRWAVQISTMLTGRTEQRGLRGAKCPNCSATTVLEDRPGDGTYRIPAVVLVTRDSLRWLVCQACGSTDLGLDQPPEFVHTVEAFDDAGRAVV